MRVFVLILMMAVAVTGLSVVYGWVTGRALVSLGGSGVTESVSGSPLDARSQGSVYLDPSAGGTTTTPTPAPPTPTASSTPFLPLAGTTVIPATPASSPIPFLPIAGATATPVPTTPTPTLPPGTAASTAQAGPDPNFKPWWVQSYRETELWSGTDDRAVSFGPVPQSSYFQVVESQQGGRFHVFNPVTRNYAYIDASSVAPSSEPPGSASPPGPGH